MMFLSHKLLYDLLVIVKEIIVEIWKDVVGWEGVYQVSSHGRMKSVARFVNGKNGSQRPLPEKILTPLITGHGYENIVTSRHQKRGTLVIHVAVAEHFIGPRPLGFVVDHIDMNKRNNRADNLRYCTNADNCRKRKDHKLTAETASAIRATKNLSQSEIALMFGVSQSMVHKVISGKAWA